MEIKPRAWQFHTDPDIAFDKENRHDKKNTVYTIVLAYYSEVIYSPQL